jgi:2-oxoglutarate dehydrogenase complex dehydrogenase (E1) component-like enzyme
VALVRIEQLAPLHYEKIVQALERYPNASQIVWFQEEHKNAGAWRYVQPRISVILEALKKKGKIRTDELLCVARKTSASPAVGKKSKHE